MALHDDMEAALAELREQQIRIRQAGDRMRSVSGSAVSKDRMITASVDAQGRLVELKLDGTRYRQLAPAELTARIVETVRSAQDTAAREAASAFAGLLPASLSGAFDGGFDLDAMFDAAVKTASGSIFTDRTAQAEKEDGGNG